MWVIIEGVIRPRLDLIIEEYDLTYVEDYDIFTPPAEVFIRNNKNGYWHIINTITHPKILKDLKITPVVIMYNHTTKKIESKRIKTTKEKTGKLKIIIGETAYYVEEDESSQLRVVTTNGIIGVMLED